MKKIRLLFTLVLATLVFSCNNAPENDEEGGASSTQQPVESKMGPSPETPAATPQANTPATEQQQEQTVPDNAALPILTFELTNYDFGNITEGTVMKKSFNFTNTGTGDLNIKEVKASCSCTSVDYPKKSIKPGEKGKIDIVFDSKGKDGKNDRSIMVISNTMPNAKEIRFIVNVQTKK